MARTPEGKRRPGRQPTGIPTESFCCRAPSLLVNAVEILADVRGSMRAGSELLRAIELHVTSFYELLKKNPKSPLIADQTGRQVELFLKTVEEWAKQVGKPLPK